METMERKKPRPRRSFTPEFKAEIVELCQRGERSIGQVARDFDLTETNVRTWVKQAEIDQGERPGLTTEERDELTNLRRENRSLRGTSKSSSERQLSSRLCNAWWCPVGWLVFSPPGSGRGCSLLCRPPGTRGVDRSDLIGAWLHTCIKACPRPTQRDPIEAIKEVMHHGGRWR
jgi:transposase